MNPVQFVSLNFWMFKSMLQYWTVALQKTVCVLPAVVVDTVQVVVVCSCVCAHVLACRGWS